MSVATNGLTGWFRREDSDDEAAQKNATTTSGGEIDQEPVVVWIAQNQMEAQVIKGRLESEDIPAIIRGETLGAIYGLTSGTLAQSAVLVPAPLAAKAELLLHSNESWEWAESDLDLDQATGEETG